MLADMLREFVIEDESGQGLVEYALIIALVGLAVIAAVIVFGGQIRDIFQGASDQLGTGTGTTTTTTTQ